MPADLLGRPTVTAADMDAMTAADQKAAFEASIVTDLDQLPADYLAELRAGAEQRMTQPDRSVPSPRHRT